MALGHIYIASLGYLDVIASYVQILFQKLRNSIVCFAFIPVNLRYSLITPAVHNVSNSPNLATNELVAEEAGGPLDRWCCKGRPHATHPTVYF